MKEKKNYDHIDEKGYFPMEWVKKAEKAIAEEDKKSDKSKKSGGRLNG